jgi:hypothetical protein
MLFYTPLLSDSYIFGGTHGTNPLMTKEDLHYVQFLCHRDAFEKVHSSTGNKPFFLTDRSQPNTHRLLEQALKVGGPIILFSNNFSKQRYEMRCNNSDAMRKNRCKYLTNGLVCQDS